MDYFVTSIFAAWLASLLPRLLLYPGGLGLLAAAAGALRARRTGPDRGPLPALHRLAGALAWLALALLPLPGAAPLPLPPDLLVLAALLLAAGILSGGTGAETGPGSLLAVGALGAAAIGAGRLVPPLPAVSPLVALPATLAYLWALALLAGAAPNPAAGHAGVPFAQRLAVVGWAGLGWALIAPVPVLPTPLDQIVTAALLVAAALLPPSPALGRLAGRTQLAGWLALAAALIAGLTMIP